MEYIFLILIYAIVASITNIRNIFGIVFFIATMILFCTVNQWAALVVLIFKVYITFLEAKDVKAYREKNK